MIEPHSAKDKTNLRTMPGIRNFLCYNGAWISEQLVAKDFNQ